MRFRFLLLALPALLAGCFDASSAGPGTVRFCDAASACTVGLDLVDLDGDLCADRCEVQFCEAFAPVDCGDAVPVDSDGDGCARECPPPTRDFCGGLAGVGCVVGEFCDYSIETACGAADHAGSCLARPAVCTEQYAPVCGCDGRTYSNECFAHGAGVAVASWGACDQPVCDPSVSCPPGSVAVDANDDGCTDACDPVVCPALYPDCNGDTPVDLDGDGCALECPGVPPSSCGGLTPNGSPTCPSEMFCDYSPGSICGWADAPGTCRVPPDACARYLDPVCGCDGQTYGNACLAAQARVGVLEAGPCTPECLYPVTCADADFQPFDSDGDGCADDCRKVCGGFAGFSCDAGEVCFFEPGTNCGNADFFGSCAVPPTVCTDHLAPVCGCDGRTYSNSCDAHAAGVSIQHDGECAVLCPLFYPYCGPNVEPVDTDGDGCVDGCP